MISVEQQNIESMSTLDKWMAFFSNNLSDEEMEAIAESEPAIKRALERVEEFFSDEENVRAYEVLEERNQKSALEMSKQECAALKENIEKH